MAAEIIEYTDPADPWAWGSEPKLRLIQWHYGDRVRWRRVLGGSDTTCAPRQDATDLWARIHHVTGMPYPEPAPVIEDSKLACLSVKAAQRQGDDIASRVLRRIREHIFVTGGSVASSGDLLAATLGVPGLDQDRLRVDLADPEVLVDHQRDWDETRRPNADARNLQDDHFGHGRLKADGNRWRYGFPTLVVRGPGGTSTVAGWQPIEAYYEALGTSAPGIQPATWSAPSTDEVLERWGSATDLELAVMCGARSWDPADAVRHDLGRGVLFLTASEARSRGLA